MNLQHERILVTGADGFIGSHLVEALVRRGCHVRALSWYNALNRWGWLETLNAETLRQVEVVPGDIRDRGSVGAIMKDITVVFHLAALIGIPFSYRSPESYVATNVVGTLNVLEEARRLARVRVLITSTSEVYGTAEYVPIDERHPLKAQSPYAATKIAADQLAHSYVRSYGLPCTIVRPFNTYGPRQSARAIIPSIIVQLLSGAEHVKVGSLDPTRDLVFVQDTVEGFCRIAECDGSLGEEINIATGFEASMSSVADLLIRHVNPAAIVVEDSERVRPQTSEVQRLLGDNAHLRRLTGWVPSVGLEEGLSRTIEWFRTSGCAMEYKARDYNI
ncbi:MAG TPA: SDR family NAD(P)-dependent oxidoreductase [Verrucomicrobiota bacterium]|nr:SDR family NAD(P)-dependent oxidoreductase [Verrucomicrobiota bacterium]